ncbi:MAG: penicillin-binding protein 1C [Paracoccus sp. (in: a-proteobacteria)]|uniref:penicillin-binding protein 1C n=1 Tax=Paracoccus sp. TaxID=267 RepID=UPI00391AAD09
MCADDPSRRWGLRLIAVAALLFGAGLARDGAVAALDRWVAATPLPALAVPVGAEVLARDGSLLRAFQVADGRWRLAPGAVDPRFVDMLLMWEDGRFRDHAGVDPRAVMRAGAQAVWHRRVVSGASTLTMQTARLLEDGPTGEWAGKQRQLRLALALERRLTKDQILDLYLRLAPYGGNVEGVRAASLTWFGREPRRLTPAQAALLVALPQSPETRRPDRFPRAARLARDRVLARAARTGLLTEDEARAAMAEPLPGTRRAFPALAPLLAERLHRSLPGALRIETTIDPALQRHAEALAARSVRGHGGRLSAGIVLADHRTGAILASVGTAGWTDTPRAGFVDMTLALRSPGSTLKPFVYGLAFDDGLAHPETLIEDRPTAFGNWQPQNFDNSFRGTVSIRQALILSLNIPVVRVAEAVGPARIVQALDRAGVRLVVPSQTAGLAITLGGAGISLQDLAQGYAALAQGGQGVTLSALPGQLDGGQLEGRQLDGRQARPGRVAMFGPVAAWQVGHILSQLPPPAGARPGRLAYKTGTSYGHRDALAVGFDGGHVGAVWLGRPDGTPVPGAFGGDLAAPVLFDLFAALPDIALPPPPAATLTLPNAALPLALRRFVRPGEVSGPQTAQADPLRLIYPPDGAEVEARGLTLPVRLSGGTPPFAVLLNGLPVATGAITEMSEIALSGPGFSRVTVIDASGASASAQIRVQ